MKRLAMADFSRFSHSSSQLFKTCWQDSAATGNRNDWMILNTDFSNYLAAVCKDKNNTLLAMYYTSQSSECHKARMVLRKLTIDWKSRSYLNLNIPTAELVEIANFHPLKNSCRDVGLGPVITGKRLIRTRSVGPLQHGHRKGWVMPTDFTHGGSQNKLQMRQLA